MVDLADRYKRKPHVNSLATQRKVLDVAKRLDAKGTLPTTAPLMRATGLTLHQVRYARRTLAAQGFWPWLAESITEERQEAKAQAEERRAERHRLADERKDARRAKIVEGLWERERQQATIYRVRLEAAYAARRFYADKLTEDLIGKAADAAEKAYRRRQAS